MKGAFAVILLAALPSLAALSLTISSNTLTLPASFDPIQGKKTLYLTYR